MYMNIFLYIYSTHLYRDFLSKLTFIRTPPPGGVCPRHATNAAGPHNDGHVT